MWQSFLEYKATLQTLVFKLTLIFKTSGVAIRLFTKILLDIAERQQAYRCILKKYYKPMHVQVATLAGRLTWLDRCLDREQDHRLIFCIDM